MLNGRRATAPGKMVLFGEYAVLFGAPAAVMAVDRRAVVSLEPTPGEDDWVVTAPGLMEGEARLTLDASGTVAWRRAGDGERLAMVALVMGAMIEHGLLDPATSGPWRMTLDTTAFFTGEPGERYKLGLGSSAALTVALASAIVGSRHLGKAVDLEWLRSLVAVHRAAQGGLGSGVDVAASLCGGTVRYQLDDSGAVAGVQPIEWPDTIFMAFVWTGQSASTGSFLERLESARSSRPGAVEVALDRLATVTEQGIDALSRKDALGFLDSVDMFSEALEAVGTVCGLPIISDPHRRLRRVAAVCGVHYKPSGAGGGDFGVCFSSDRNRLVEFSRSAAAEGFATPKVDQDPSGAEITGM